MTSTATKKSEDGITVWEMTNDKGKDTVKVKKSKPATFEGKLTGMTRYFLRVWTDEGINLSLRSVDIDFEVKEASGKTLHVKKTISSKVEKFEYRFSVATNASWTLNLTSAVVIKALTVHGNLHKIAGFKPEEEYSAENISVIEREIFSPDQLDDNDKKHYKTAIQGWPDCSSTPILHFPMQKPIAELSRDSDFKKKAIKEGTIRPFLLLVSMHPETRIRWAKALGIDLLNFRGLGDAHREADKILTADFHGIQARATHAYTESARPSAPDANWYQILQRVTRFSVGSTETEEEKKKEKKDEVKETRKTRDECMDDCRDPNSEAMVQLENYFCDMVMDVINNYRASTKPDLHTHLQSVAKSREVDPLVQKLRDARFSNEENMRMASAMALTGAKATSLDDISDTKEKVDEKQEHKEKIGKIRTAIPAISIGVQVALTFTPFFVITPLIFIPITLLAVNSTGYILKETPGRLLVPLIGLMSQRELLAFNGVRIEDYYGGTPLSSSRGGAVSPRGGSSSSSSSSSAHGNHALKASLGDNSFTPVDRLVRKLRVQFPDEDAQIDKMSLYFQREEVEELIDVIRLREEDWIRLAVSPDLQNATISIAATPETLYH